MEICGMIETSNTLAGLVEEEEEEDDDDDDEGDTPSCKAPPPLLSVPCALGASGVIGEKVRLGFISDTVSD